MKPLKRIALLLSCAGVLASVWACSNSGGAKETGATLYQQVGGSQGMTSLANQFGTNISMNPQLSAVIDAATITALKSGLTNDVMKASAMSPSGSETLASALQGKNLDASSFNSLTNALAEAGAAMSLDSNTISSLTGLLKPVGENMLGQK